MALRDRVRAFFTPLTAPSMGTSEGPIIDANAHPRAQARDIDPNNLRGGGNRFGNVYESASAIYNMFTGQGSSRDPSSYNWWATPRYLGRIERFGMGRNALIQQAIGKLPSTATRAGWRVDITDPEVEDKQAVAEQITAYEQRLNLPQRINRALFRGRQHSQALVILGVDDGRGFEEPVDFTAIKTIRWAVTIDSRDFNPYKLAPATSTHYGRVEVFEITDTNGILEDGLRYGENSLSYDETQWRDIFAQESTNGGGQMYVHADRVLYFPTADYYSLLDSLQDSLGAYFETMGGIRTAARESSMLKYRLSKLKQQMWSKNGDLAREHMSLVAKAKSAINAFVVDSDEDVEFINRPLGGVADLANPIMAWVAAALSIPNTVFWQVSPGGFGKGEAERDTWHEDVNAFQDQVLTPELTLGHALILAAWDGPNLPPDTQREIKYNDLTPPDEELSSKLRNEALIELRQAAKDGLITRSEWRTAAEKLCDQYYCLELDKEFVDKPSPAPVGIFTGSIALLESVGEGTIPPEAGRALLLALDPIHFNALNISSIIPIEEPQTPTDPSTPEGTPDDPEGAPELGDEEDGEGEPSELDIVWAEAEAPAGAKTAKELEADPELGATSRQIKSLSRNGKITNYRGRGFSKEPLFLLEEVKRALLVRQGVLAEPVADLKTLDEETIKLWLAEHISDARKMPRDRKLALKNLEGIYPYLAPPDVTTVYRGLRNVSLTKAGKLLGMSNAVVDKSWTTDIAIAAKFASTQWTSEEPDSSRVGAVLVADAEPSKLLLNYALLAELPGVADRYHDRWEETLQQAILDEKEVLALEPLHVRTVKIVPMADLPGDGETRLVKDIGPRSVCVMLQLPKELACWVPYKAQDTSPPHITLAYCKDVPSDRLEDVLDELRETFESYDPIKVRVVGEPVHYFDIPDGRVAHARAEFDEAQETFNDLLEAFGSFGLSISKHDEYKPHVTLAYLTEDEYYSGPTPDGTWLAASAVVTYGDEQVGEFTFEGREVVSEAESTQDKGPLITAGWIWRTQGDSKVRAAHRALNGKRFKPGTKDAKQGAPGDMPNCRCAKEIIVPPKGTKRARAAAERTTRRALRQNYERVTGKALKRAAAKKIGA